MADWSEAAIAELRELWAAGLSASKIGAEIGMTKNAVIGKAHRLQLPARVSPIKRERSKAEKDAIARLKAQRAAEREAVRIAKVEEREREHALRGQTLRELPRLTALQAAAREAGVEGWASATPGLSHRHRRIVAAPSPFVRTCQYPMWDDKARAGREPHFCGDKVTRGPYCAEHAAVCYVSTREA